MTVNNVVSERVVEQEKKELWARQQINLEHSTGFSLSNIFVIEFLPRKCQDKTLFLKVTNMKSTKLELRFFMLKMTNEEQAKIWVVHARNAENITLALTGRILTVLWRVEYH